MCYIRVEVYEHDANYQARLEWTKWLDRFQVAIMAKYSISVRVLTKTTEGDKVAALISALILDQQKIQ